MNGEVVDSGEWMGKWRIKNEWRSGEEGMNEDVVKNEWGSWGEWMNGEVVNSEEWMNGVVENEEWIGKWWRMNKWGSGG